MGKRGPIKFSDQLGAKVCGYVALGVSLRDIAKRPNMPAVQTILSWLAKGDNGDERFSLFLARYERARAACSDLLDGELGHIAHRIMAPAKIESGEYDDDGKPVMVANPEYLDPQAGRAAADILKWRAAKMRPQRYGEQQRIDVQANVAARLTVDKAPDWLQQAVAAPAKIIEGNAQPIGDDAPHIDEHPPPLPPK